MAIKRSFRGAAFADYDNDGDVDVFLTALDDRGLLLRNDTSTKGHYLAIRLIGSDSNRDAVGTRVVLQSGGRKQTRERKGGGSYLSSSDARLHFGLGAQSVVERLEIRWPGGKVLILTDIAADRTITVQEGRGIVPPPATR